MTIKYHPSMYRGRWMLKGGVIGFGRMGVTHYSILNTHDVLRLITTTTSERM